MCAGITRDPNSVRRRDATFSRCLASACLLLIGNGHVSPTRAESACATQQQIRVDGRTTWRCGLSSQAQQPYLVQVDAQRIDIALELLGPDGKQVLKVDSPTLRSGPELMFVTIGADRQYSLVVSAIDHRAPKVELRMQIEDLARTAGGSSLACKLLSLSSRRLAIPRWRLKPTCALRTSTTGRWGIGRRAPMQH
jgi:hypothetical protein